MEREKKPLVKCHALLRCKSQECREECHGSAKVWNRNKLACINIKTIVEHHLERAPFASYLSLSTDDLIGQLRSLSEHAAHLTKKCELEGQTSIDFPSIDFDSLLSDLSALKPSLSDSTYSLDCFSDLTSLYSVPTAPDLMNSSQNLLTQHRDSLQHSITLLRHRLSSIHRSSSSDSTHSSLFLTDMINTKSDQLSTLSHYIHSFSSQSPSSLLNALTLACSLKAQELEGKRFLRFIRPSLEAALHVDHSTVVIRAEQLLTEVLSKNRDMFSNFGWEKELSELTEYFGFLVSFSDGPKESYGLNEDQLYFECEKLLHMGVKFQHLFFDSFPMTSEENDEIQEDSMFALIDDCSTREAYFHVAQPLLFGLPSPTQTFAQSFFYKSEVIFENSLAIVAELKSLKCKDVKLLANRFRRTTSSPSSTDLNQSLSMINLMEVGEKTAKSVDTCPSFKNLNTVNNRKYFSFLVLRHLALVSSRISILSMLNYLEYLKRWSTFIDSSDDSSSFGYSLVDPTEETMKKFYDHSQNTLNSSSNVVSEDVDIALLFNLAPVKCFVVDDDGNLVIFQQSLNSMKLIEKRVQKVGSVLAFSQEMAKELEILTLFSNIYKAELMLIESAVQFCSLLSVLIHHSSPTSCPLYVQHLHQHLDHVFNVLFHNDIESLDDYSLAIISTELLTSSFGTVLSSCYLDYRFIKKGTNGPSFCPFPKGISMLLKDFGGVRCDSWPVGEVLEASTLDSFHQILNFFSSVQSSFV
ncbi:hypothetical protein GEMRC1_003568 [Eukaryota sp. GEM-RC1]